MNIPTDLPFKRPKTYFRFILYMGIIIILSVVFFILIAFAYSNPQTEIQNTVETNGIKDIEIEELNGRWYVQGYLPSEFDDQNVRDYTIDFDVMEDKNINMNISYHKTNPKVNTVSEKNQWYILSTSENLKGPSVLSPPRLYLPILQGKYLRVFDFDKSGDGEWMVLLTPNRRHLWIMSRSQNINSDIYHNIYTKMKKLKLPTKL
ncbi:MAG: lipocalin family protein, partial [Flavobacteriaceae bacterium]|nr:lipocalin family protein [Flavobacteriaceae bacterium]